MSLMKKEMNNLMDDVQKGMKKAEYILKDTVEDVKDDAKGIMMSMEMKKDEMLDEYDRKQFSKKLKKQMQSDKNFK
ncbi:MAG: hypothetical protein ACRDD7_04220 [Peptostreptococcaceae bacterium]